jgi:hypothetical protein
MRGIKRKAFIASGGYGEVHKVPSYNALLTADAQRTDRRGSFMHKRRLIAAGVRTEDCPSVRSGDN